jgi:hypothetical protein
MANEPVRIYGQAAVATVQLDALQHRTRADRVALLQYLAEQELRPLLCADSETHDLALVIGYDPALGLVFWARIDPDPSRCWQMAAGFDPASDRLVVGKPRPVTPPEPGTSPGLPARPRVVLRRTRDWARG